MCVGLDAMHAQLFSLEINHIVPLQPLRNACVGVPHSFTSMPPARMACVICSPFVWRSTATTGRKACNSCFFASAQPFSGVDSKDEDDKDNDNDDCDDKVCLV